MIRKILHILFLSILAFNSTCAQSEYPVVDISDEIEHRLLPAVLIDGERPQSQPIKDRMDHFKVPGVSIAVINENKIVWTGGFGKLRAGSDIPITNSTLFQAASMSKPLTATAVLYLTEKGSIELDEDINEYLHSWKLPENSHTETQPVTLRHLLNHTAGINVHGFPGYPASQEELPELREILEGTGSVNTNPIRANSIPGNQWSYSGGGYTIIQQIIEDVTDNSFSELMKQVVLEPLEMTNSTFSQPLPKLMENQAAIGHINGDRPVSGGWYHYPEQAAAGLWTTPGDISQWIIDKQQTLLNGTGKILSVELVNEMLTPDKGGWGLGPELAGQDDSINFKHSGANKGFRCYMVAFAKTGQGIVVMTNSDNGTRLAMEILRTVAFHYNWPDYKPVKRTIAEIQPEILENYTGLYQLETGMLIEINVSGKGLVIKFPGEQGLTFLPSSESSFFDTTSEIELKFNINDTEKSEQLLLSFGVHEITGNLIE